MIERRSRAFFLFPRPRKLHEENCHSGNDQIAKCGAAVEPNAHYAHQQQRIAEIVEHHPHHNGSVEQYQQDITQHQSRASGQHKQLRKWPSHQLEHNAQHQQ